MVINIEIDGIKKTIRYFDGLNKRIKVSVDELPRELAKNTRSAIRETIRTQQKYIGEYHRKKGKGLADSISFRNLKNGKYEVRVDPARTGYSVPRVKGEGNRDVLGPVEYAGYVENKKGYFERGFRQASTKNSNTLRKQLKKIAKGN